MSSHQCQWLLLATFLPWCWLMMMVVHEVGHVVMAWATGATVERVVLHPLAISRTDLAENPNPLLVSWAGAVIGCILPVSFWLVVQASRLSVAPFARFFAGFCLVANGAYLGVGACTADGDAGDLFNAGAHAWQLAVFGIVAFSGGLWLWHGLGPAFGFTDGSKQITRRSVIVTTTLLIVTVDLELLLSPW